METQHAPDIIVIRHRRENIKKCSLRPLELSQEGRAVFYRYPLDENIRLPKNSCLLHLDGEALTQDVKGPLVLLDATWRYASVIYRVIEPLDSVSQYRLPEGWNSAYPRRQEDCSDPSRGLASIEALYVACLVTGRKTEGLLDGYYWKELFFNKNEKLIKNYI